MTAPGLARSTAMLTPTGGVCAAARDSVRVKEARTHGKVFIIGSFVSAHEQAQHDAPADPPQTSQASHQNTLRTSSRITRPNGSRYAGW